MARKFSNEAIEACVNEYLAGNNWRSSSTVLSKKYGMSAGYIRWLVGRKVRNLPYRKKEVS